MWQRGCKMSEELKLASEVKEEELTEIEEKPKKKKATKKEEKEPQLLDLPGVGAGTVSKLEEAGVYDIMGVAAMTPNMLAEKSGMSVAVSRKVIQAAYKLSNMDFITATEQKGKDKELRYISFGCKNLDGLIGGYGIRTKSITEAFGHFGSGKSQISMSLAVQAQLPDENGKIGKVVYIDTEGSFRTDRIEQFAKGAGLDPDKVLDNIMVARAFNSNHQILLMDKVKELLKNKEPIKLIIVDSLTAHFRTEYDGRGQLAPRQQTLNKYIKDIQKIADLYNIAVYVTNQVMSDPAQMFGDPTKPVGGNIVGHACLASDTIVLAKDGFKELRDVEVGDYIWGRDRFVKVYDKMEKKVKKCKEIRSNNFITASEEHKFPLHTSEGIKDEIVEDIYVGDVFISPEKINVENKDIKLNIKPKRLARLTPVIAGVIKQSLSGRFKDNKELELLTGITIRQLRRVINELYPTNMSVLEGLIEYTLKRDIADMDYIFIETKKHRNIEIPEYLDEKIGRLYGAWLCDGSKTESRSFKITKHEKDYLEKLNILVEESFGISGRITKVKDKDAWRLVVNSVEIVNVFNSININELINIEDDILIKFLASLIDGDGSFSNGNMTFSQKNSKLVTKIQMMLYRFSIKSAINRDKDGIYSLSIYAFNRKKLEDNLINHEKYKHPTPSKRNREQVNNHSIKSMEEVGEKEVYDISVDGEYFLANGVITHNSAYRIYLRRGAKDSRIAKLVDAPEFEDSATAFNVEENGLEDIKV